MLKHLPQELEHVEILNDLLTKQIKSWKAIHNTAKDDLSAITLDTFIKVMEQVVESTEQNQRCLFEICQTDYEEYQESLKSLQLVESL